MAPRLLQKDFLLEERCELLAPALTATGAQSPGLAAIGHQHLRPTTLARHADEAIIEDAALQKAFEGPLHFGAPLPVARRVAVVPNPQQGLKMVLHDAE